MTIFSIFVMNAIIFVTSMGGADKTVQNLKDAYAGESTASAKYAIYAQQAKRENFLQIASLFEAASKSEAIHASNHKAVLEKMGTKPEELKIPEITPKTTKENLEEAIKGETYEVTTMYPAFLKTSREESASAATKSFTWALDTEKKHINFYTEALTALKAGKASTIASLYYVCPKCGNTYSATAEKSCSFCMTPNSKFIKFGK